MRALFVLALLCGCGCGSGDDPFIVRLSDVRLNPGESKQLTSLGAAATASWSSGDPAIATISPSGRLTAGAPGMTTITATLDGESVDATVTVLDAPGRRWGHAMVYDAARQQIVLFGGSAQTFFGDTWTWDGTRWHYAGASGPSPRDQHVMAYDQARMRVVLHGGRLADGTTKAVDTWEWDGTRWEQRATDGPPAREHASGGYHAGRARTVLFGGQGVNGDRLEDTWEWDGTRWERRATTVPAPLALPSRGMAYDPERQRLLMGIGEPAQLWEWDGAAWSAVADSTLEEGSPLLLCDYPAGGAALALTRVSTTYLRTGTGWDHINTGYAPTADLAAMAYDAARQRAVLFGGLVGTRFLNVTYTLEGETWLPVISPE